METKQKPFGEVIEELEQEIRSWQITVENRDAEILQLKAELEAVGAGGVQPLRASPVSPVGAAPDGWQLVPTTPTLAMGWAYLDKAHEASPMDDWKFSYPGYEAAIAAAPQAPIPATPAAPAAVAASESAVQLHTARAGRVYVAGPMSGLPDFNFPAFNTAAAGLRAKGWHVENPAEHGIVDGAEWADYMHYDMGRLATCAAIYLLPGWSKSRGAMLEVHVATTLGMTLFYADGAELHGQPNAALATTQPADKVGLSQPAPAGEYPALPMHKAMHAIDGVTACWPADEMRAYADATNAMRAGEQEPEADSFREWFSKNYPTDTIILDPDWHARSIYRMAMAHARLASPVATQGDQLDAKGGESAYQCGYRHGYNRRDAEVQGALL